MLSPPQNPPLEGGWVETRLGLIKRGRQSPVPALTGGNLVAVAIVPFILGLLVSALSPQSDRTVLFMWLLYAFAVVLVIAGVVVWWRARR